jgi:peptidyl-prolyl cis-trans isomerase B (cyclophilin B)
MYQPPAAPAPGSETPAPQQQGAPQAAPAYGQQPYAQQSPTEKYNVLAIISLVTSVIGVSLAGIICGHIGLSQIGRTGEKGRGLAIAGLVLGYLGIVAGLVLLIVLIPVMVAILNDPSLVNGY